MYRMLKIAAYLLEYRAAVEEISLPPENAKKILDTARDKIELLRDIFIKAKLVPAFLLDVILTQIDRLEVK